MKLSVEFLKKEACNFDLECVFELNLNGKGKWNINCYIEWRLCAQLIHFCYLRNHRSWRIDRFVFEFRVFKLVIE